MASIPKEALFFPKVSAKEAWVTLSLSVVYLLLSHFLIGTMPEQLILVAFFLGMYYLSRSTRHFITAFAVFIVFWILFDYMKAFPNFQYNTVHIQDLYQADKHLFHVQDAGRLLSANEYWQYHHTTALDLVSGFSYLCWMPVPLAFGIYLFVRKRDRYLPFALTFLLVNLIGFVIYYLYPAAPPWYVQQYGFSFNLHTPGNTAGLHRFDDFWHIGVFQGLYAKSSNVFAAMPSLHAAYPLITFYFGLRNRIGWVNIFLGMVVLGIWFGAIYSGHHYVLDVLAGITCAVVGIIFFERGLMKTVWFKRFLAGYNRLID